MDASSTMTLNTGNRMPVIGLGTWLLDEGAEGIARAIRAGYRMIDTSSDYGTQPDVGAAVRGSEVPREELYVVTKVEEDDDALDAARAYVQEMGLEYADLVLVHRPPPRGAGEELWRGLIEARREGVARDIGVSNYSIEQLEALIDATGEVPAVNQIEWSPFGHSMEMLRFCERRDVVVQAYSPLTRGERLDDRVLRKLARRHARSPAQVLLRWNLQLGTVPLPKARGAHVEEDLEVFDFELARDEMERLTSLNRSWSSLASSLLYA